MRRRLHLLTAVAAAMGLLGAAPAPAVDDLGLVPDEVPDRGPVLAEPLTRGEVVLAEATTDRPTRKHVDGDPTDWVATPTRTGGASAWGAGEHVHTDFLFDAHGADDGGDRDRLDQFAGALYAENRASRIDQVLRTSGSQLGVPEPLGAPDEYGDAPAGLEVGDLTEVRWAAGPSGRQLSLLARVANLTDASQLGVLVLADHDVSQGDGSPGDASHGDDTDGAGTREVGLGTALTTDRFDRAALLTAAGVDARDLRTGTDLAPRRAQVAVSADGWDNALEASLPTALLATADGRGAVLDVAVLAGRVESDGSFTPLNAAYRHAEPVEIYNDRLQALDLLAGTVDRFSSGPIAVADLADGRTQPMAHPGPGYHERQMPSAEAMSRETGQHGALQPYGLYVPSAFEPGTELPITYWLHYRGGKAHSGPVINPRLVTQLGEEPGHLVVFPHARGTSEWYVAEAHQDVFEVMADVEGLLPERDPLRRYVSGYSMGGYGSWLFATLYPDLFAAGFVQSGAVTQGAWLGGGPDDEPDPFFDRGWVEANGGDARAQLTYRALANLRHVPFAIDHGTNDELVFPQQLERMAARLTELGYAHRFTRFLGYEHFTQAIVDEWADGAAYLSQHAIDPNPREVTYTVVPVLTWAVNHVDPPEGATFDFRPDGAYWVDDVVARDVPIVDQATGRPADATTATITATSEAIPAPARVPVVDTGVASPPGHSTPYVRSGLSYLDAPGGSPLDPAARRWGAHHGEPPVRDRGPTAGRVDNRLVVELANVSSASVDVARAQLALSAGTPATITVTSDGPAELRLRGANTDPSVWDHVTTTGEVQVLRDEDDIVLVVAAGTTEVATHP